jgi:hypothetical protein
MSNGINNKAVPVHGMEASGRSASRPVRFSLGEGPIEQPFRKFWGTQTHLEGSKFFV